jgi:diguanylate cyclase (GGDEF)-like protein/PAS domain S-box-containing protein
MDQHLAIQVTLWTAAAVSIVAAGYALLLIPVSRMPLWWSIICAALGLQALRRIYAVSTHATVFEAVTGLLASALFLVGLIGIRAMFITLRRTRRLLDKQMGSRSVVDNRAGAAIVVLDPRGRVIETNDSTKALLASGDRDLTGLDWFETFVPEASRDEIRRTFDHLVASTGGNDEYVEYSLFDFAGREHSVVWHRRLLRDSDGRPLRVRSAGVDMTDSTFLEKELAFRSLLLDHTNDSVIVYRFDGIVVYANDMACTYRGVRREDIVGSDIHRFVPPRDSDAFAVHLETVGRGSCVTFETEVTDRQGVVRPLESHVCPVSLGGDRLVVDVARDVTERREAESAIRRLAYTDHLTGLPNRVLLYDRATLALARARRSGERLALLFMDLDRIKQVNDSFGHAAGDELLRQVGARLAAEFRDEDTVSRIGGDEFVVFARVVDLADAERVATRLVELMAEPFVVGGDEVFSSASVGLALYPEHGDDLDGLIAKADAAMYAAKEQGRARFRVHGADETHALA